MKSILVTGLLAVIGLSIFADPADARWRRRRCNTCAVSTCQNGGCQASTYYTNDPNAQAYNQNGRQPSTTFYRGDPNSPPQAPSFDNRNAPQPRLAPVPDAAPKANE